MKPRQADGWHVLRLPVRFVFLEDHMTQNNLELMRTLDDVECTGLGYV
jgi:hypothetical protein